jgi:hypothetical protein
MSTFEDVMETPMISISNPKFASQNTDTTPQVDNENIVEPNFLNTDVLNYEELPKTISRPVSTPVSRPTNIIYTRLWNNELYIKRIKKLPHFKKLHEEMFPTLSLKHMAFVYHNYFTQKTTPHDTSAEFKLWDAPDRIKEYVRTRMVEYILSDH